MLDFVKDNRIIVISFLIFCAIFIYVYCNEIQDRLTNKNVDDECEDNELFIPSEKFIGEKIGFVFKMDENGLGYYKDKVIKLV